MSWWVWAWGAVGLLVLALFLVPSDEDDGSDTTVADEVSAACRAEVRAQLRSPSSADFVDESVFGNDAATTFTVSGAVDAQNGFGADIRNAYRCNVSVQGESVSVTEASVS